jgi:hypothetical protein
MGAVRNLAKGAGRPFVLVFALSLLLAGCGGGGGGGDGAPAPGGGGAPPGGGGPGGGGPTSGWNSAERISNLRGNSIEMFKPAVALTGQDVGFVAWTERVFASNCAKTWVNRNAAGAWGTPTQIGIEQGVAPAIAANATGDAVLVWIERGFSGETCGGGTILGQGVWASRYSAASNTWTPPVRISVDPQSGSNIFVDAPSVVIDAAGRATAVWVHSPGAGMPTISWSRFDGAAWSAPAALSDGTRGVGEPVMAQDGSGNVLALWRQDTNLFDGGLPGGGPMLPNIWFARYAAGAWSTPVRIGSADLAGSDSSSHARIAVNASGNAVAVWSETRSSVTSIASARYSSGAWTAPALIEASAQHAARPEVAIDDDGNAQAVWMQKVDASQTNESGYTARFDAAAASWSAPELFEQSAELVFVPLVGIDDSGRALIAWEQTATGTGSIHAVHYAPASGFGTPVHFAGDSVAVAVNGGGTALLASSVPSLEPAPLFFGISIRAALFRP